MDGACGRPKIWKTLGPLHSTRDTTICVYLSSWLLRRMMIGSRSSKSLDGSHRRYFTIRVRRHAVLARSICHIELCFGEQWWNNTIMIVTFTRDIRWTSGKRKRSRHAIDSASKLVHLLDGSFHLLERVRYISSGHGTSMIQRLVYFATTIHSFWIIRLASTIANARCTWLRPRTTSHLFKLVGEHTPSTAPKNWFSGLDSTVGFYIMTLQMLSQNGVALPA
jgi:hypothetical protein